MSKQWTNDEIDFLKEHYKTMTYKQLSQSLNRTKAAIDLKINRLGLKKDKYSYDHNYFENINSEDRAYWLGFIFADGSVCKGKNNSCELSIKLQGRDADHLRKFNQCINGNNEIATFKRECNLNGKSYDGCQIRLYSQKIVDDLSIFGVVPNKSLIVEMPNNIQEQYIRHFIRGVFDGDGCITKNRQSNGWTYNSYVKCDFTSGSTLFLEQLRAKLYEYDIKSYIVNNHDEVWKLVIGGMENCDKFLHFIYDDATVYLDRKFNKKQELYEELQIEQRLLRRTEKSGFINLSEKENGNPEMEIRVEGCV